MIRSRALRVAAPIALAALLIAGAVSIGRAGMTTQGLAAGDCTVDPALDTEELYFLQLINDYRAQNGRGSLAPSHTLSKAAQWKSQDMATNRYFAHDDLTRSWSQRIRDCGYGYNAWIGENIAAGNSGALATFNQWKNSPAHNDNMLNANYTAIGIGRAYAAGAPYGWYWTNEFGSVSDGWPSGTPATNTPTRTSTPTRTATATPTRTAVPPTPTRTAVPPTPTRTAAPATPTRTAAPAAPTATATAPSGTSAHVSDIDGATAAGGSRWRAVIAVWVHDAAERPVAGAAVKGKWYGVKYASCTTNSVGYCIIWSPQFSSGPSVKFSVTSVTSPTRPYAAPLNHDPDGSSNGTTITITH